MKSQKVSLSCGVYGFKRSVFAIVCVFAEKTGWYMFLFDS